MIGPQNKFIYNSCREYDDNDYYDDNNNDDDDDDNPLMDFDPPETDMFCLYLKKLFEFKFFSPWSISTLQGFHIQYGWHITDAFKWIPSAMKPQSVWTQSSPSNDPRL
jgi:hypothetical protein